MKKELSQLNKAASVQVPFYRADLIRGIMASRQITVETLVEMTKRVDPKKQGVSNVTISRIRMGRPIDMKKIRLVTDALAVEWSELFRFDQPQEFQKTA
jgi:hypothetical protein